MKCKKQPKRYVLLDYLEWRAPANGINEYRKQIIDEDGGVEVCDSIFTASLLHRNNSQFPPIPRSNLILFRYRELYSPSPFFTTVL